MHRTALALLLALVTLGASPRLHDSRREAVASFSLPKLPFLPGSIVPLEIDGLSVPYDVELLGPGRLTTSAYYAPQDASESATLLASGRNGVAMRTLGFARPPDPRSAFIAVASYDDGVVIHDDAAPYRMRSVLGVGGAPSDVAIDRSGTIGAAATNGVTAALASIDPWRVASFDDVPFADEVAFDESTHAFYATDRDQNGSGALTRIMPDGTVRTRILGLTSEGIAVDAARRRIYVANTNDGTISIVDADSLVELRRFTAVARVFSLALNAAGTRLYAVSNQSYSSPFAAAGSAIAIDVSSAEPRIVARSAALAFPVGVAVDDRHHRIFVTDERDDDVYVLDPRTLHATHAPLRTCRTPWKPHVDEDRLYLPCARADQIDVIDTATLARTAGAPFRTGGYPLAVAVWHPKPNVVR